MKFSLGASLATVSFVSATGLTNSSHTNSSSTWDCSKQCKPFTIDVTDGTTSGSQLVSRQAILTNGTLPGPPLKLKVGDCVDFKVINHMSQETGVHFHGIRQLDTPWSDGTPGLTQYAIKSGDSYTYRWTADEVGVYFYHSHYKAQMMDGLYGAIVISSDNDTKPFSAISALSADVAAMAKAEANVNTILASDWNQFTAQQVLDIEANANIDYACTDSIILNGQGSTYCLSPADLAANARPQVPQILAAQNQTLTAKGCIPASNIPVQGAQYNRTLSAIPAGAYDKCTPANNKNYTLSVDAADKYAALSFISPAGIALFSVTIDGHKLYVYEINGHYVQPQTVDQVSISPGDRVSFFVKLDQAPADYTIRVANAGLNQVISGYGVLSYKGASGASSAPAIMNYGGVSPPNATIALLNPFGAAPAGDVPQVNSGKADRTFVLDVMKNPTDGEGWSWVLNGADSYPQSADDQVPLLYAGPKNVPDSDLVLRTNYNEWVDLIIKVAGPLAQPHPIHKHANKFYVIGAGTGDFNYTTVEQAKGAGVKFNFANPAYVDGYTSTPAEGQGAWMVFRYQANTPGAWYLHCHIQTHFSGGMAVAILDGVDKWPTLPANPGNLCPANGGNGTSGGNGSGHGNSTTTTPSGSTSTSGYGDVWSAWGSITASAVGPKKTQTVTATRTAVDWSLWSSIIADASASTAKHGGATTVLVGATPNSQPAAGATGKGDGPKYPVASSSSSAVASTWGGWADPSSSTTAKASSATPSSSWGQWDGASSTPVKASSTSSASWSAWSADGSSSTPVKASSTGSSSWSAWSGAAASSTPVAAVSASSSWAAWSSGAGVSGVAAATGSSSWATWQTSATPAATTQAWSSYNGTNSPVAAYTGAASTVSGRSLLVTGMFAGVIALLL